MNHRDAAKAFEFDEQAALSPHRESEVAGQRPSLLKTWTLLAYGGVALPLILSQIPILLYLPAFYAKEMGLSAGFVGLVFLSARFWDGLFDMIVGWLSDRTRSRWGRRKPWVIAGAPCLMLSTWFLCNPPADAGLLYLAVWAALFYTADAIVKIPHLSWGTELASGYLERSRVTAFRGAFSMVGSLVFVSAPLIFLADNAPLGDVLRLISLAILFALPLTVMPLAWSVPDMAHTASAPVHLIAGLVSLAKDRAFVSFFVMTLFYFTAEGVINSLAVFAFRVGLQLPDKLFWVIFLLYVSALCSVPLIVRLARHVEKHHLLACALALVGCAYAIQMAIPRGDFPLVAAIWIVTGIGHGAAMFVPTSILADLIDRNELATGDRRSGACMAVYNLVMKIGLALGVGLSFGLLELVDFDPGAARHDAGDIRNILLLGFGLPALLYVPAIFLIWHHPITQKIQQQLRAQIEKRGAKREG